MKLYFMLTTIAATAAFANADGVAVSVNGKAGVCFDKIHTSDTIIDWYQYDDPDNWSANTGDTDGLEDNNSGRIGIAAVEDSKGTHVVVIYDQPEDGSGGSSDTVMKCKNGCNAGEANFLAVTDDTDEGISQSGAKTFTSHDWQPCCTDGFATKALEEGDELCIRFKNDRRNGLDEGIWFYEGFSDAEDITPGNYDKAGRRVNVCIKIGCGPPQPPPCAEPCTPLIDGQPGDGLVCQHDNYGDDSCRLPPGPSYPLDCYAGMSLCKALKPPHEPCDCENSVGAGTYCQHNNDGHCRPADASNEDYPYCDAGETICTE